MELSLLLMEQIVKLFFMIFMGYLIVKVGFLKPQDSKVLSTIVLYLITPCVILNAFQVEYTQSKASGLLLAFAGSLILLALTLPAVNLCGRLFKMTEVERMSVYYSNAGNLIVPIVTYILGAEWVLYACAYMCLQIILFWTHCRKTLSREKNFSIKKIVFNVNIISTVIAASLFYMRLHLPEMLIEATGSVASMVGPASMFVVGMLIAGEDLKKVLTNKRAYLVTFFRLIMVPLFSLLVLKLCGIAGFNPEGEKILLIVFLAVTTPAASTVTQMSQLYDNDSEHASTINVLTTLASIITMPLMVLLYQTVI